MVKDHNFPPISVEEARGHLARGESELVRVSGDRIEGSIEIEDLESRAIPKDREIIFYCC